MKISVVIPNYNGIMPLRENLPRVVSRSRGAEIIVVDDASTDGSAAFLRTEFPSVRVLVEKKNTGYSSAVNLGVREASGDLVVLLNSDAYPENDYLAPLLPYFQDLRAFAVGMLHKSMKNGRVVLRGAGRARFEKGFLLHSYGDPGGKETFWVNGGAGIFRKSVWVELGGMREIYDPFYWEDIDLSFRAVKAGYGIFFEPSSIVVHAQKKGAIRSRYSASEVKTISYRNQFLFVWLNYWKSPGIFSHIFWLPLHFLRLREMEFYLGFFRALGRILFK